MAGYPSLTQITRTANAINAIAKTGLTAHQIYKATYGIHNNTRPRMPGTRYRASGKSGTFRTRSSYLGRPAKRQRRITSGQQGYLRTAGNYGRYVGPFAQELKWLDATFVQSPVATAGNIVNTMIVIPQGTTESERIGRKVVISKVMVHYFIELVNTATLLDGSDVCRVIFYIDKQTNGATATVLDILQTADEQSFRNLENSGRFTVLMDRQHSINATAASGNGSANDMSQRTQAYKFYKSCNIPVEYDSTTGAITEIKSNNVSVMVISKYAHCHFNSTWRFRYRG